MQQGKVIKGYSSFYYVQTQENLYECKLRGKLKLTYNSILVGDDVFIDAKNNKGIIQDILPRKTVLVRPPIANVELGLVVFSLANPDPVLELLDRIVISLEYAGIKPVIVFTKADLVGNLASTPIESYRKIGYEVLVCRKDSDSCIEMIRSLAKGKISVVAGPSGAGKSTLLNKLQPGLGLKTGEVSNKIGRGKHTTRHVELLPLESGGYIADTPGFSVLYLPDIKPVELAEYYRELAVFRNDCKFTGCLHKTEPNCAVKDALENGEIDSGRYERYLTFLEQLIEKEKRLYD